MDSSWANRLNHSRSEDYTMENNHPTVQTQPGYTRAIFEMSCPSLSWRSHGNAATAICNACFALVD